MAEYINKDVLIEHIKNAYWADFDTKEVIALINQVPTADVQAEIESLQKLLDDKCDRCIEADTTKAYKQFADRVKTNCYAIYDEVLPSLFADVVDDTLKEMIVKRKQK